MSRPFTKVLMVTPEHFSVEYAINPYMKDAGGKLHRIDRPLARAQWTALRDAYRELGYEVEEIAGVAGLPDMVFAANQSFPFWHPERGPSVVLSRMRSAHRAPELEHFRRWYEARGYHVIELERGVFEGNGDCLLDPEFALAWGGYGPRTDAAVYPELEARTGLRILTLALTDPDFYHLDTCFSILDGRTVALQPGAFTERGLATVRKRFSTVIEIDREEAREFFSGNAHCPNGRDVFHHRGAARFPAQLAAHGFRPVAVDTGEFLKSGGSVFCLKMMVF